MLCEMKLSSSSSSLVSPTSRSTLHLLSIIPLSFFTSFFIPFCLFLCQIHKNEPKMILLFQVHFSLYKLCVYFFDLHCHLLTTFISFPSTRKSGRRDARKCCGTGCCHGEDVRAFFLLSYFILVQPLII
jgi:hypothetical protein